MRVIEAVAARLDQSVRMAGNLGIELPTSGLSSLSSCRSRMTKNDALADVMSKSPFASPG